MTSSNRNLIGGCLPPWRDAAVFLSFPEDNGPKFKMGDNTLHNLYDYWRINTPFVTENYLLARALDKLQQLLLLGCAILFILRVLCETQIDYGKGINCRFVSLCRIIPFFSLRRKTQSLSRVAWQLLWLSCSFGFRSRILFLHWQWRALQDSVSIVFIFVCFGKLTVMNAFFL